MDSNFQLKLLGCLFTARYFSCSVRTTSIASVVPQQNWESSIDYSYEAIDNPVWDLYGLFGQIEPSIVASVQSITNDFVKADNEKIPRQLGPCNYE